MDVTMSEYERCVTDANCPAVFELSNGDIAFIGADATAQLGAELPVGAGVGPGEKLVVVPAAVLRSAGWTLENIGA